jgi:hypothetical protein
MMTSQVDARAHTLYIRRVYGLLIMHPRAHVFISTKERTLMGII